MSWFILSTQFCTPQVNKLYTAYFPPNLNFWVFLNSFWCILHQGVVVTSINLVGEKLLLRFDRFLKHFERLLHSGALTRVPTFKNAGLYTVQCYMHSCVYVWTMVNAPLCNNLLLVSVLLSHSYILSIIVERFTVFWYNLWSVPTYVVLPYKEYIGIYR